MLWTMLLPMHARPMDIILVKQETCFSKGSKTVCPSGLRGWTQVPLAQAAWVQIPQLSILSTPGISSRPQKLASCLFISARGPHALDTAASNACKAPGHYLGDP